MTEAAQQTFPADDPAVIPFSPVTLDILADLDCICWRREMSPDGTITYPWFSENVSEILGYPSDQVLLTSKGELAMIHWADRDTHMEAVRRSAETLQAVRLNFRVITASGETRWLRGSSRPHKMKDGRITWDSIMLDITKTMLAEVQHQTIMDHAADCIIVVSADECITWSNASAGRHFGFEPEQMTGRCIGDLIIAPALEGCSCRDSNGNDIGTICLPRGTQEVTGRRKDGTTFPFELTVSEVRADGKLTLIVIGRDITRRRNAERQLEESERRLRLTFAAASFGIVVVDMDGAIRFYNPAFETLAGDGRDTLVGVNLTSFLPPRIIPEAANIPPPGMAFSVVCEPCLGDGSERHWRLTGTRFSDTPDNATQSMLFFVEDVTETTRVIEERRQMELMLQEGHKLEALGRLAGGVAHELNNMLAPILMGGEMIARTAQLDERNSERVQRIIDAAKNSRDIVRNVLTYCRNEQHSLGPLDLAPLFEGFAAMAASILPPTVKVEKHRDIAHAFVIGDPVQLQQILINLANNARDAMFGVGTLRLELTCILPFEMLALITRGRQLPSLSQTPSLEDAKGSPFANIDSQRPHVLIRVSDTGCGMSQAIAARIFDPFFTTKPVGQGTGLGLSVVQGILKGMNGVITVDSQVGAGAVFEIYLPLLDHPPA